MAADEILTTVKTLFDPGDTIEVRLKKGRYMYSGYYDYKHFDKLASDVVKYDESPETEAIYFTANPVQDRLIARAHCNIKKAAATTGDKNTKYRKYLLIDIDPDRPSETCGTNEEHDASIQLAYAIAKQIHKDHGWPVPFIGDSGNGAHVMYRIDQPNTPEAENLCKTALDAIKQQYGNTAGLKVETWRGSTT